VKQFLSNWWTPEVREWVKRVFALFVALSGAIGVVAVPLFYINNRIKDEVRSEGFIRQVADQVVANDAFVGKLAERISPYLICDGTGRVLMDRGAHEFLAHWKFDMPTNGLKFPDRITVTPKRYMSHAPLVTSLDDTSVYFTAERGTGVDWVFSKQGSYDGGAAYLLVDQVSLDTNRTFRIRVEVLY
jgi:hypothetical protein